jgi:hypothetical protein
MFRILVMVYLMARDGEQVLARWLTLPFPPWAGLDLVGLTSVPDFPVTVEDVCWDISRQHFVIELEECVDEEDTLANLTDEYGSGWEELMRDPHSNLEFDRAWIECLGGRLAERGLKLFPDSEGTDLHAS